jgi:hypothetical protein
MYTIICVNGHERKDARPRGVCTICGLLMRVKPKEKKKEEVVYGR